MKRRASTKQAGLVNVWKSFDTLRTIGVAAQHFPRYVNSRATLMSVDVVLLTCIVAGRAVHLMGGREVEAGPGHVGITHYGQRHALITDAQGIEVINLYLDLENHPLPVLPRSLQATLARMLAPHPGLVHRLSHQMDLQLPDAQHMFSPLRQILREQALRDVGHEMVMTHALMTFLIQCTRAVNTVHAPPPSDGGLREATPQPAWVEVIRQMIDERFDEPLCLDDMTQLAGVSPEHVCRRFKAYTGRSPMAYLNDRRIQAAMWHLRTDRLPLLEIALACGFENASHFGRKFKAMVGMTPGAYRRQQP